MGKLIVIEGTDGSGKGTQAKLLEQKLKDNGYSVVMYSFPGYEKTFFGKEVGAFLRGEFGTIDQVHPKLASMLYAGDRFEHKQALLDDLSNNDFVICDRYVESNMAHQGAKLKTDDARFEMFRWIEYVEYEIFGIPRPDKFLFLDVPVSFSKKLVLKKKQRTYTNEAEDIHEADHDHIQQAYVTYNSLAVYYNWSVIQCVRNDSLSSIEQINSSLVQALGIEI